MESRKSAAGWDRHPSLWFSAIQSRSVPAGSESSEGVEVSEVGVLHGESEASEAGLHPSAIRCTRKIEVQPKDVK
jgi:hypothetical protein